MTLKERQQKNYEYYISHRNDNEIIFIYGQMGIEGIRFTEIPNENEIFWEMYKNTPLLALPLRNDFEQNLFEQITEMFERHGIKWEMWE